MLIFGHKSLRKCLIRNAPFYYISETEVRSSNKIYRIVNQKYNNHKHHNKLRRHFPVSAECWPTTTKYTSDRLDLSCKAYLPSRRFCAAHPGVVRAYRLAITMTHSVEDMAIPLTANKVFWFTFSMPHGWGGEHQSCKMCLLAPLEEEVPGPGSGYN